MGFRLAGDGGGERAFLGSQWGIAAHWQPSCPLCQRQAQMAAAQADLQGCSTLCCCRRVARAAPSFPMPRPQWPGERTPLQQLLRHGSQDKGSLTGGGEGKKKKKLCLLPWQSNAGSLPSLLCFFILAFRAGGALPLAGSSGQVISAGPWVTHQWS